MWNGAEGQVVEWHDLPNRKGDGATWVRVVHPYDFTHPNGRVQRIGGLHAVHYTAPNGCYLIETMGNMD